MANFGRAPEVRSDASKSKKLTAGGYVSRCGMYNWWRYGRNAARHAIDYLEGDSALQCWREMGASWYKKVVPHAIDNMAFERSVEKGRSKVERLNCLLREAFAIQVAGTFVVEVYWISTHDNVEPDLLSRDQEEEFLRRAYETGFWAPGTVPIRHGSAGQTRVLPERRGELTEQFFVSNLEVDAESRHSTSVHLKNAAQPVAQADFPVAHRTSTLVFLSTLALVSAPAGDVIRASVPYSRAHLTSGLPAEFLDLFEQVMANRYTSSSWGTINSAVNRWRRFADLHDLPVILPTDHASRGGWMVAWVLSMVQDSNLVFKSIQDYVWGMRVWQTLQHQADPVMGLMNWESFMAAVQVIAHVPAEPRKAMPMWVLERIIDETDWEDLASASLTFLLILLMATFSRSECPLPKSKSGRDSFDKTKHWRMCDMDLRPYANVTCLWIRFQRIKQDQRMERPEAAGNEDWAILGPIPGSKFCPVQAAIKFNKLRGPQAPETPLFCDPQDVTSSWTYDAALRRYHERQDDFGIPREEQSAFHGGRIAGFNNTKNGLGEEIAVAHGGWRSRAHKRYDRFRASLVARISAAAFGLIAQNAPPGLAEEWREVVQPEERVTRDTLQRPHDEVGEEGIHPGDDENGESGEVQRPIDLLPPGWTEERKGPEGRMWLVCHGPNGERTKSRVQAWRRYEAARDLAEDASAPEATEEATSSALEAISEAQSDGVVESSALAARPEAPFEFGSPRVRLNTHIRFGDDGAPMSRSSSSVGSSSRRHSPGSARPRRHSPGSARPRLAQGAAVAFPDDLNDHVVEFDRASTRRPPRARHE